MKKTLKSIQAKYGIVSEQAPTMRPGPDVSKPGELPSYSYEVKFDDEDTKKGKATMRKVLNKPGGLFIILNKLEPASRKKVIDQIVEVLTPAIKQAYEID